jgi:monofunctional glycosyltransferase
VSVRRRIQHECRRLNNYPHLVPTIIAQQLLVSGEDHRHAIHPGFDPIAIGRAIWRRVRYGSHEGASTIEQQIVRVITERYERTLRRKLREIFLAVLVARSFPKAVLPAVYLSIAYYGWRMNGYAQACWRLGLSPQCLTLEQASALVARLKYPQPKKLPCKRTLEIERRAKHLRVLYRRHMSGGNYRHLNDTAFRAESASLNPLPQC